MKPVYRLHVQEGTGNVVLWADTKYGSQPILGWRKLDLVKDFANLLFELYWEKEMENMRVNEVSERLLEEAFGDH